MDNGKQEYEWEVLINEVYENYPRINKMLCSRFPTAFDAFNSYQSKNPSYPTCYFAFFHSYGLNARYWPSNVLNSKYAGTFTYCIYFSKAVALRLDRKSTDYRYPYINSRNKAIEKLVPKAFEIIECLLTGKTMPEKERRF